MRRLIIRNKRVWHSAFASLIPIFDPLHYNHVWETSAMKCIKSQRELAISFQSNVRDELNFDFSSFHIKRVSFKGIMEATFSASSSLILYTMILYSTLLTETLHWASNLSLLPPNSKSLDITPDPICGVFQHAL